MTTPAPAAPAAPTAPAAPAAPAPTGAAPAAPAAPSTPLSPDPAAPTAPAPPAGDWSGDWRTKMAKGDPEALKQLERFESPVAVFDSLRETKKKLSSTRPTSLPANATAEQITAYRAENGIPETPEGYKLEPGEGRVIGDDDKPIIDAIVKNFHGKHASPAQVNDAVKLYFDLQDSQIAQRETQDVSDRQSVEDSLHRELGGEYRANINAVAGLLKTFPDGIGDEMLSARLPDGTALFNNVSFMRTMIKLAKELNPASTIVPGSTANSASTMGDRITAIKALMADTNSEYWKGTPDQQKKLRGEYESLVSASERLKQKAA